MKNTNSFWDGLYRSREGWAFGVCTGIGRWRDVPVWLIRVLFIAGLIFGFFLPAMLVYVIAAIIMPPEPVQPFVSQSESDFYHIYSRSKKRGMEHLRGIFRELDRRTQRLENYVTSKEFRWESKLRR